MDMKNRRKCLLHKGLRLAQFLIGDVSNLLNTSKWCANGLILGTVVSRALPTG